MNLTEESRDGILILRLAEPRLDAARAPVLREMLVRKAEEGHNRIVLDLSRTEFMDSSGLGALVSCLKRLGTRGTLAVAGAQGAVERLFKLTRMDRVFALHPTVDAAVAQMGS